MYENALATIVSVDSDIISEIVKHLKLKLDDPRIRQITKDDYFTYLTPEDELYDKSVLPGYALVA